MSTIAASIAATVIVGAVMGALLALTVDMVVAQPIKMAFGDQAWGHWNADEALAYAKGGFIGGGIGGRLAGTGQLAGALNRLTTLIDGLETIPPLPAGWEAEVALTPLHQAYGGDFSLATLSPDGRTLDVVLGDITGHGMKAAPAAIATMDSLGALLEAHPGAEFMPAANDKVGVSPNEPIFPAQHLTLDLQTGEFTLTNAGSIPAARYDAATGEWVIWSPKGPCWASFPTSTASHCRAGWSPVTCS